MRERGLWTLHLATGVVILPLLALHMAVMHLDDSLAIGNPAGGHAVEWANVIARAQSVGFAVTYPVLLIAALFHGFYGVRNILFELNPPEWLKRLITAVLVLGGLALAGYGSWAAIAAHSAARAVGVTP